MSRSFSATMLGRKGMQVRVQGVAGVQRIIALPGDHSPKLWLSQCPRRSLNFPDMFHSAITREPWISQMGKLHHSFPNKRNFGRKISVLGANKIQRSHHCTFCVICGKVLSLILLMRVSQYMWTHTSTLWDLNNLMFRVWKRKMTFQEQWGRLKSVAFLGACQLVKVGLEEVFIVSIEPQILLCSLWTCIVLPCVPWTAVLPD